jgi:hypothetical protein
MIENRYTRNYTAKWSVNLPDIRVGVPDINPSRCVSRNAHFSTRTFLRPAVMLTAGADIHHLVAFSLEFSFPVIFIGMTGIA